MANKKLPLLLLAASLFSNSCSDTVLEPKPVEQPSPKHYMRFNPRDSLGYGWPNSATTTFYSNISDSAIIEGEKFYLMQKFLLGDGAFEHFLIEDSVGNIQEQSPFIGHEPFYPRPIRNLYKANVPVGETWKLNILDSTYSGSPLDTLQTVTLESKTDTVRTTLGEFTDCLRIKIDWIHYDSYEYQWYAPNVGLVKREYFTASLRPGFMHEAELNQVNFDIPELKKP